MTAPYSILITEVTGNVLSASDYNSEHQNHCNNNIPTSISSASANVSAMQTTVDPGESGTESLATDLLGELQRIRFTLVDIKGTTYWYETPAKTLAQKLSLSGGTMTGALNMGSQLINALATGTAPTDAINLAQLRLLLNYRRPVLKYSSGTVVEIETGLDGTSGDCSILFPDGTVRTITSSTLRQVNLATTAVLSGTTRGGLRTGSQTANTWYACYAVKVTDNSTDWVGVADTLQPTQASFATLNSNFGTNGWVYLGAVRNGNGSGTDNTVLKFVQAGNKIAFYNSNTNGNTTNAFGMILNTTAGATSLAWAYATGTSGATVPVTATLLDYALCMTNVSGLDLLFAGQVDASTYHSRFTQGATANPALIKVANAVGAEGVTLSNGSATSKACDIFLTGWTDAALGVGAAPSL